MILLISLYEKIRRMVAFFTKSALELVCLGRTSLDAYHVILSSTIPPKIFFFCYRLWKRAPPSWCCNSTMDWLLSGILINNIRWLRPFHTYLQVPEFWTRFGTISLTYFRSPFSNVSVGNLLWAQWKIK